MLQLLKRKYIPALLAYLGKYLIKGILLTCRVELSGFEKFLQTASSSPCILSLWHNRLLIAPELLTRYAPQFIYAAVISNSKDGEFLTKVVNSYSQGKAIRVPHNARHKALLQVVGDLQRGKEVIVFTPDGPRGPRYKIKQGMVWAARETEAKIIPLTWSASRFWQMGTWDKMIIPKPFSKIFFSFGDPALIQKNSEELDMIVSELENSFTKQDDEACYKISSESLLWPK